ncbi:hypothetical protein UXN82_04355 [Enterobacter hormaechei]
MSEIESLLEKMLECDAFHHADSMVSGIAQAAIDKGFNNLSVKQQKVLEPFLTHKCAGTRDPGGYHNGCEKQMSGSELEEAYEQQGYYDDLLCQDCREESDGYEIERERFMRD